MEPTLRSYVLRFAIASLLFICAVPVFAQTTGRVNGVVTDPTGANVAGAKVLLANDKTGFSRTAETNKDGYFVIPEVPVGSDYRLEIERKGFKKSVRRGMTIILNQVATVDTKLALGEAQEVVDVSSEAPLVDTSSTQIGAVVDEHAVTQLPLNARDTYQFMQLQPGVQSQLGGSGDLFYGSDRAGAVSVNGGRGRSNNFNVNGGDANDQFANLPTVQPSPDSIQEFRVLTNTFDAEYGRNSGAVVNVVTKSGTNKFHGNLYEFFRNKVLNAKGYFDTVKPDFQQNQYGATFGGPIKKDRTFFFLSYEGRNIKQGRSSDTVFTPTAAERAGNFGADFGGSFSTPFIADVLNGRPGCAAAIGHPVPTPTTNSPVNWSDVFPGGVIPTACMDPVALNLMNKYMPPPNNAAGYWQGVPNSIDNMYQGTARIDHRINDHQNLSFYYYVTNDSLFQPFAFFQAAGADVPGFGSNVGQRFQQYNLSHTWTLTNSIVNEARIAYNREAQRTFQRPENTNLVTASCDPSVSSVCFTGVSDSSAINALSGAGPQFGITPNLGASYEGVPFIVISGGATIGNNFEGQLPQVGNSYQFSDNLSWVKGNHTFKFGTDIRDQRFDQTLYYNVNGYYSITGASPDSIVSSDLYPNYLLGMVDSYSQGSGQVENVRSNSYYLFAQDSWKATKSLTVNYGLRWELDMPLVDKAQHVQTFRPGQNSAIYPCQLSSNSVSYFQGLGVTTPDCNNTGVTPTGLVVPGDKGVPPGLTQTYYKAWAPRIGIAWSPSASDGWLAKLTGGPGKMTVHTGYGIFYNPIEQLVLEQFGAEPPFGGSSAFSNTWFNTPFVSQSGGVNPNPFNGILNPPRGQPVDWSTFRPILLFGEFQPNMRTQYSEQYNFTIERELARDLVLSVGYVGSQGHRLLASHDLNPGNPQTCLDLHNMAAGLNGIGQNSAVPDCGPLGADSQYLIPAGTVLTGPLHLPYGPTATLPAGYVVGPNGINIVGTRPYSAPNCDPLTGTGCPADGVPVFSNIFAQDTIGNSNYNSLQVMVEKKYSRGLQFQGAYTWSKSIDQASSFEETLNPFNFSANRSLSLFDARHRLVLSYTWDLPLPKYKGFTGKLVEGWTLSGITTFQSGFPIRLQTQDDTELISSLFFAGTGAPSVNGPVRFLDPKKNNNYWFDSSNFSDPPLGQFGNLPRTMCCGPGTNNWDFAVYKRTNISESKYVQFRAEFFNVFNHTQFYNPDGNFTDGSNFGLITRARDPRLIQLALKFYF